MPEEPQFHITLVTQKRRYSEHAQSSHSGESGQSAAKEQPRADAQVNSAASRGEALHIPEESPAQAEAAAAAVSADSAAPRGAEESDAAQTRSANPSGNGSPRSRGRQKSSHRRHYLDYGTVNLGTLQDSPDKEPELTPEPDSSVLTQGELQHQFYEKYDTVLNRRYQTRNRTKVTRIILISLLAALVLVVSFFALSSFTDDPTPLEKPVVSTIPVETLDLG